MKDFVEAYWHVLEEASRQFDDVKGIKVQVRLSPNDLERFHGLFAERYDQTRQKMKNVKRPLDRHKVAALLIACTIEQKVIEVVEGLDGKNVALERLAIDAGLSYMLAWLNEKLAAAGLTQLEKFYWPATYSEQLLQTSIFARCLYYWGESGEIEIFSLAYQLYLFEYISLLKHNIDPEVYQAKLA